MVAALSVEAPSISLAVSAQSMSFLLSCGLGAALGVLYDVFRITRKALPLPVVVIAAQDLLFFLASAFFSFAYLMTVTDGKVRWFVVVGEILGATVYYFTVGAVVMKVSDAIIRAVKAIVRLVWRFTGRPVLWILSKLSAGFHKNLMNRKKDCQKMSRNAKYTLKRRRVLLYNFLKAKQIQNRGRRKSGGDTKDGAKAQKAKT